MVICRLYAVFLPRYSVCARAKEAMFLYVTDHDDLWELQDIDKVDNITNEFWEHYARCNSVLKSMAAVVLPSLIKGAGYMLIYASCQMGQPLLLRALVNSIQNKSFEGLYYALGLFALTAIASLANQHHLHHAFRYAVRVNYLDYLSIYTQLPSALDIVDVAFDYERSSSHWCTAMR